MAGAEEPDLVALVKIGDERRPFARLRLGAEPLRVGPVGVRGGGAQGQAFDDALDAPVAPVVEQIGGPGVLARLLRLSEIPLIDPRCDRAARRQRDSIRRAVAREGGWVSPCLQGIEAREGRFGPAAAMTDAAGHRRHDADEHCAGRPTWSRPSTLRTTAPPLDVTVHSTGADGTRVSPRPPRRA